MKALVLAAALAALSSAALAGAAHDARQQAVVDTATDALIADAGRLGAASLTALNGSRWSPAEPQPEAAGQFGGLDLDTPTLLLGAAVFACLLSRPLGRVLRRQAQQRRAIALASTLHTSRG